ncbi:MAG: basic amino acid ABC transporter substrate-binding protein [bacterium]
MIRASLGLLLSLVLVLGGCQSQSEDIEPGRSAERTELRIGTDATYPPFETVDPATGRPHGFDIELVTEICRRNGWRPEFIVTPFDAIIPGLMADKYDLVVSAMTITPKRAAVVAFSEPYYLAGQSIAVPLDQEAIGSIDDLVGKRVGVQLGTTGELMAKQVDGLQVFSYDNIGAAFIDMDNGNLDAVLNDLPTTMAYITRHATAKTVGGILSTEHYGMAVRPDDTLLLGQVNTALRTIRTDGSYDSLHVKWFGVLPVPASVDSTPQ